MKILIIHNKYKIKGGEDVVCEAEFNLLKRFGNEVKAIIFDNKNINNIGDKLNTLIGVVSNSDSYERLLVEADAFKPDIIQVHNFFPLVSPVVFELANEKKIPIVLTLHNYRLICPGALLLKNDEICEDCIDNRFAYKAILNKCYRNNHFESAALVVMNYWHNKKGTWRDKINKFILLTDFARDKLLKSALGVNEHQLVVKPNFVPDYTEGKQRNNRFLFVGRLSKEKGINLLIETFSQTSFELDIIGEGPMQAKVEDCAEKNINIHYLGLQQKEGVIKKMQECKALIFPSLWYEGMPMTILEAFSCGCPIIASNIGAMKSLIKNGVNGLLFEVGNKVSLQEQLSNISQNLNKGARESYLNEFTSETNYKNLIKIYEDVMKEEAACDLSNIR